MSSSWISASVDATRELGAKLGAVMAPGDFVGLVGPLGAGKTEFCRGIAQSLGVGDDEISSPTFAIIHQHHSGRIPLNHADLYRVVDNEDLASTGYFDLLATDAAWVVEWPGQVRTSIPEDALLVTITNSGDGVRKMSAECSGPTSQGLLRRWNESTKALRLFPRNL